MDTKPSFPHKPEPPVGKPETCSLGRFRPHRWAQTATLVSHVCWIWPAPAHSHPLWPHPLFNPRPTNPVIKRLPIRCPVVSCSQIVCVCGTQPVTASATLHKSNTVLPCFTKNVPEVSGCHMLPAIRRRHALHRLRIAEQECPPPATLGGWKRCRHATTAHTHTYTNMPETTWERQGFCVSE
jgi:hypothetical protein